MTPEPEASLEHGWIWPQHRTKKESRFGGSRERVNVMCLARQRQAWGRKPEACCVCLDSQLPVNRLRGVAALQAFLIGIQDSEPHGKYEAKLGQCMKLPREGGWKGSWKRQDGEEKQGRVKGLTGGGERARRK